MSDLVRPRRAILSVSDKTGLIELAQTLASFGVEIISTGGTALALMDADIAVTPVENVTGFPEIMHGRVKTLHPKIHGGILARRDDPDHAQQAQEHQIEMIDLVCINLYPFEKTIAQSGVSLGEAIEQIDIGGPSMIRSASKNHNDVVVLTDPAQYQRVIDTLNQNQGSTSLALRMQLAVEAFDRTSRYDRAITQYLSSQTNSPSISDSKSEDQAELLPERIELSLACTRTLRYGENPHQAAAVYSDPAFQGRSVIHATQHHGKELSYNNLNDADAAMKLTDQLAALEPGSFSACVIKHANPCGAAIASSCQAAVDHALLGDPLAAFGGILAVSGTLNEAAAARICQPNVFLEVILADHFEPEALSCLQARWKNVRLLELGQAAEHSSRATRFRFLEGGLLGQRETTAHAEWACAAGAEAEENQLRTGRFLEVVGSALASNAIAIGGQTPQDPQALRLFGAGAGQMDRVGACRIAVEKAGELAQNACAYSDAFFPFPDGPAILIIAGIQCIFQPGGSKRDEETFALCNEKSVSCVVTGTRRFRH